MITENIDADLSVLIKIIPNHIRSKLLANEELNDLLEVVLDLGRLPEARFLNKTELLDTQEVTEQDIDFAIANIGLFGADNRAGIERTLHRISAIRNRSGKIVGLTLRVGRTVYGTIKIIEDLIYSGKSVLLLGKPGIGKTTMLREIARVLSDDAGKRVIVVDTSNEIAGDGDIPHRAIGRARRMQVHSPTEQHNVMIEAVENHMPEVIIIDEIGTELETTAARTIAERGVQLVATAHGNELKNLMLNPTLSDLVGGIQTVTLGDLEARRRKSQKTVLERNAPPTFDIVVEIQGRNTVTIHADVATTIDKMLRNKSIPSEIRKISEDGEMQKYLTHPENLKQDIEPDKYHNAKPSHQLLSVTKVLPYGVNRGRLEQIINAMNAPIALVTDMNMSDIVITTKNYHRRNTKALQNAEEMRKPVFVLRRNSVTQIEQFIKTIIRENEGKSLSSAERSLAILETEKAIYRIINGEKKIELKSQNSYIRKLQHELATENGLESSSMGREPSRRVIVYAN